MELTTVPDKDYVKVRQVGGCLVITLPKNILHNTSIREGDRVLLQATSTHTVTVTLEGRA